MSVNDPRAIGETAGALCVRPLDVLTWPAFARLVEANNGVWGGCWCMGFHVKVGKGRTPAQNRAEKEQRVREGGTHAALVLDGDQCLTSDLFRVRHNDRAQRSPAEPKSVRKVP